MPREATIRTATPVDAPAMRAVEAASWPAAMAASVDDFEARLRAFPEGQFVAEVDGQIVGLISSQRIPSRALAVPVATYLAITDAGRFTATHDSAGDVFQIVGVGVAPEGRGHNLGRRLVDRAIALGRSLAGVTRIVGFTRPARYHQFPAAPIDEYVQMRNSAGKRIDPVLGFHLDGGARLVSVHPDFRPEDAEARGYGVLIEYPPGDASR